VWVGCPSWYCTNGQSAESGSPIPNQETARKWGWMLTNQKRSSGCDQYFSVSSTSRFGTDTAYPLQYRYSTVQYVTNYSTVPGTVLPFIRASQKFLDGGVVCEWGSRYEFSVESVFRSVLCTMIFLFKGISWVRFRSVPGSMVLWTQKNPGIKNTLNNGAVIFHYY
jgi:hypothetical protein